MSSSLEAAVDELYSAFAGHKRPRAIDHCTHCVRPEDIERLLAPGPLREVPVEHLRAYTVDALSTAGSESDLRYFLPRILHIAGTGGFDDYPDLDLVMSKVSSAGWRGWPEQERHAVTGFAHALWSSTLSRFPTDPDAEEVLRAIGVLGDDLTPYLRAWEAALTGRAGASHLRAFVHDHFGRAGTEFWLTVPCWPDAASTTVKAWLGGPLLTELVAAAAETVPDEQTGDILLEILAAL